MELAERNREINRLIYIIRKDNVYIPILKFLYQSKFGLTHGQIKKKVREEVFGFSYSLPDASENVRYTSPLKRLRESGLVEYSEGRYFLTERGRELCKNLFEE